MDPGTAAIMREAMIGVVQPARPPASRSPGSRSAARPAPPSSAPTRPGPTPGSSASPAPRARTPRSRSRSSCEGQPEVSEQTGGRVAAPIAQAVLKAALEHPLSR